MPLLISMGANRTCAIGAEELTAALRDMGVRRGDLLMVHTCLPSIGPVVGGGPAVLGAMLQSLGSDGTLAAYVSWEHSSYAATVGGRTLAAAQRQAWPAFDISSAPPPYGGFGQFNQILCAHPDVHRSAHPEASIAAIGTLAGDLTRGHGLRDGYGPASPLGRLAAWGGRVLMLGAAPSELAALHVAEAVARLPGKRRVRYEMPLVIDGERTWCEAEEFDRDALLDTFLDSNFDVIAAMATEYVASGHGRRGRVGNANSWLFEAGHLIAFGAAWLEDRFARPSESPAGWLQATEQRIQGKD